MAVPDDAVLVEFQATRPDGCITLELNATRADLAAKGLELREGQLLRVWEPWGDEAHIAEGVVRWDEEWGWGVEVNPDVLLGFQP